MVFVLRIYNERECKMTGTELFYVCRCMYCIGMHGCKCFHQLASYVNVSVVWTNFLFVVSVPSWSTIRCIGCNESSTHVLEIHCCWPSPVEIWQPSGSFIACSFELCHTCSCYPPIWLLLNRLVLIILKCCSCKYCVSQCRFFSLHYICSLDFSDHVPN